MCAYHNTSGHDLSECKVMLDQAQKMRANWAAQSKLQGIKRAGVYKTFKGLMEKEVNLMMKRHIKQCTQDNNYVSKNNPEVLLRKKKELWRKQIKARYHPNVSISNDSSDKLECHHMELAGEFKRPNDLSHLI